MIALTITMNVSTANRQKVVETVRSLTEPTKVQEGCLSFDLSEDLFEEGNLVLNQKWRDKLTLTRHMRSGRFRSLLIALDLLGSPPRITLSYVSHELELESIEELMTFFGTYGVSERRN